MSGRIGISLASTVSRVMEVPATHSSGVKRHCPAWTEAISSSVDAKIRPPRASMVASFGWTSAPGTNGSVAAMTATTSPKTTMARLGTRIRLARAIPSRAFTRASSTTTAGDPRSGIRTNGMITLAEIAPTVLTAISEPDSRPACRASSASSAEAAGKLRPMTTVTGRTTRIAEPVKARSVASDWLGMKFSGRTTTTTSPSRTSPATEHLRHGQEADRVGDPRSDEVEQQRADRKADEEDREDDREHVRRVPGP